MPSGKYLREKHVYSLMNTSIDNDATIQRLGYAAIHVSPGSLVKVSCRCTRCNTVFDRIRRRITSDILCRSCAHVKGDEPAKHPLKSGYEKVEVCCTNCKKPMFIRKMSLHSDIKCYRCRKLTEVKHNPYIDAEETKNRFGHDVSKMPAKSFDRVVVRCAQCETLFERIRRNVIEEPLCIGCSHGKVLVVNSYIDDVETQKRFGYQGSTLMRKAQRMVVFRCVECGEFIERKRCNIATRPRCDSCRYPTLLNPYIDVDETIKQYNYDPQTLARQSNKHVIVHCANCNSVFSRIYHTVKEQPLCHVCLYPPEEHIALDDSETMQRFGYKASEVPRKSTKRVVGKCTKCGSFFERARHNVTDTPVCRPCTYFIPPTNHVFGKSENDFGTQIETCIGRSLQTQFPLTSGQFLDFYDTVSNIGIEYNGLFWHNELSPSPRGRTYHSDKQRVCTAQGIDLIMVFEDEWKSRPKVVLDVISVRMGVSTRVWGARQCRICSVSFKDAVVFFNENHIQGAPSHSWETWGLYTPDNELVADMLFGPHHRQGHPTVAVLSRLGYARGVRVTGGAQRLLKAALPGLRHRGCTKIVTWSDNRWFSGHVYEHLGFVRELMLPPDYTYVVRSSPRCRLSKQSQCKNATACPENKTEHQWALERGLARVWDCGRQQWVLPL